MDFTLQRLWIIFIYKVTFGGVGRMVGNSVKIIRQVKQLTQEELAKELKITRQTVIALENEKKPYSPSLELSLKMAKFFNLKVEELFYLREDE
ncbi:Helix-turn-helix domain protein [compost metagenome]